MAGARAWGGGGGQSFGFTRRRFWMGGGTAAPEHVRMARLKRCRWSSLLYVFYDNKKKKVGKKRSFHTTQQLHP